MMPIRMTALIKMWISGLDSVPKVFYAPPFVLFPENGLVYLSY